MITGYLTAKIGRLFLLSFGGIFLLAAVMTILSVWVDEEFLRYQGYLPSPWPVLRRVLHVEPEEIESGEIAAFLRKNTTFKVASN